MGGGAFGEVFKGFAVERNNEPVAVKIMALDKISQGDDQGMLKSIECEI